MCRSFAYVAIIVLLGPAACGRPGRGVTMPPRRTGRHRAVGPSGDVRGPVARVDDLQAAADAALDASTWFPIK